GSEGRLAARAPAASPSRLRCGRWTVSSTSPSSWIVWIVNSELANEPGGGADAGIDGADSRAAQAPRPPVLATLRRPTISAPFPTLSRQNGIRATWNEPAAGTDDSPTGLS